MATRRAQAGVGDDQVGALLERHHCEVPFPAVRAWGFGATAAPAMPSAPSDIAVSLWRGESPACDRLDHLRTDRSAALTDGAPPDLHAATGRWRDQAPPTFAARNIPG